MSFSYSRFENHASHSGIRVEVAELFEPSIEAAVASIRAQIEASQGVVRVRSFSPVLAEMITDVYQSVWLVGGFAASPWLFSQLQERLAPLRVTVSRPDSQTLVYPKILFSHLLNP